MSATSEGRAGRRGVATADLRRVLTQLASFLVGSSLGLSVDLVLFALGVGLGAPPWLANAVSAGCAVVVVYLFVTRYAFWGGRSRGTFAAFVACYVLSIGVFSVLIDMLHQSTGWAPLACKLLSLPPSFAVNFLVSRALLHRDPPPVAAPAAPRTQHEGGRA